MKSDQRSKWACGDAVLQLFARVVRETLRATDLVGRLGGEEFVALLPGTALETAVAAERVRAALAAAAVLRRGQRIAATVSVGIASGSPTTPIDALITRADDALYRAKQNGRNRVEIAVDPDDATAAAREQATAIAYGCRRKEEGAANHGAQQSCIA